MSSLSTHVLDTSTGRPAVGVSVRLSAWDGAILAQDHTDDDGRVRALAPEGLEPGSYRLRFDTGAWFAAQGVRGFYPEAVVSFTVAEGQEDEHFHVPLLLSPFGWSTYRGS
ncbi:hydroxyisourate hydrolase [Lapillicoccus jejuensis]|uniref:5-hydroxyisourate hydrolase n=1 Tax=Lapillicoccus jejuensis TaxID=402171 RepID=A0A542E1Q3_9MICO|nr:hydroxyisourate hydrolase [Lapillicoccus jejuensis]TQJ09273.1 5-hydroxyisourate hydrolase [Lapillicoccus jejuensis]